jgi:ribonuclease HII
VQNAERTDPFIEDESAARVSLFDDLNITEIGLDFERLAHAEGFRFIAGIDEVGRGCIAGPVVAAACILDIDREPPAGINDSKKLTAAMRDEIAAQLKQDCVGYAIGEVDAGEIDRINILEATKLAMLMAIDQLLPKADFLLIDALRLKQSPLPQKAIIKGDSISASIAAASILAKTYRDELMTRYDADYPQYGFAAHKGYGCRTHYDAIRAHAPSPIHRMSFKGVVEQVSSTTLF